MKAIIEIHASSWEELTPFYPLYKYFYPTFCAIWAKVLKPKLYCWDTNFGKVEIKLLSTPKLKEHISDKQFCFLLDNPGSTLSDLSVVKGNYVNLALCKFLWSDVLNLCQLTRRQLKIAIVGADVINLGNYIIDLVQDMRFVTLIGSSLPRLRYLRQLIFKEWGLLTFVTRDRQELRHADVIFLFSEAESQWGNWPILKQGQILLAFDTVCNPNKIGNSRCLHEFYLRWHDELPAALQLYFEDYLPPDIYEGLILLQADELNEERKARRIVWRYLEGNRDNALTGISKLDETTGIIYVG